MIEPLHSSITINYHETATSSITDLTGTKWEFNESFTSIITGSYFINFISNGSNFSDIFGERYNSSQKLTYNNTIACSAEKGEDFWKNEAYRTIEITGGSAVTNANLISWLQANATQIQDEEPEPEPEPTPSNPNLTDIFTDVANAIRAKTGKSDPLYPVNFANEIATIEAGGGGAELNIHYSSTTAPSDTSKLWVKTDTEPEKVSVSKDLSLGTETISTLSTTLPTGTDRMAGGVVGTKVYLFGGYNGSANSNKIYCFDTETEIISTLSTTLPTAMYGIAGGAVGTKVYLFGGYIGGAYGSVSNKIYCFDATTETISTLSATLPTTAYGITSGVVGTKVYLFGGTSSGALNKIYRFDTTTETISTLSTTLPTSLSSMASGVVGNRIYLFGGVGSNYSNKIYRFDTTTETISTLSTTLPTTMMRMSSGVVGTNIYLFGGNNGSSGSNQIYRFDTTTETISTLSTTLPTATYNMVSGAVGTKIYLFGGYNGSYSSIIYHFAISFALAENNLLLLDTGSSSFNLVNSNALVIEAKPKQVYIGDSNDEGEYVESALYVNGSWQPIG